MRRHGMALPTALFMALVLYFLSTVLTWQAQTNQRFTRGEAERAHELYATRGQVNLFIARVLENSSYADAHGPGSPVEEEVDGATYRTWCQPDSSNPDVLHVICSVNGKLMSYQSSRTIVKTIATGMIIYTDAGGAAGPPDLKWYGLDEPSPSWNDLPPPPKQLFQQKEVLLAGAPQVPPVFETEPVLVDMADLVSPIEIDKFAAYGIGADGDLIAIYEPPPTSQTLTSPTPLINYPTMFHYDRSAGTWALTRMPDSYVPTGTVGARIGGTDGTMVVQDGDGLMVMDPDGASERVPAPPGGSTIQTFTANSDNVYAQLSDGSLARYTPGGGWSTMLAPQPDVFTSGGELISGSGSPPTLSQLTVSPNGTLMALWQRDGVDTVFRYYPGSVEDEEPPQWDARLPLSLGEDGFIEDLDSITAMPGRVISQVPGPPEQIFAGRSPLPSPGANAPVIATGIYVLPDNRYYAGDSY